MQPSMTFSLLRADDQLVLDVGTYNLTAQRAGSGYQLQPTTATQSAFLVVTFPPQQLIEYAATETKSRQSQGKPIFTDRTRVVFHVPPGAAPIPLSVSGILEALRGLELVVDQVAGAIGPAPAATGSGATAAELLAAALPSELATDATARVARSAAVPAGA